MARDQSAYSISRRSFCRASIAVLIEPDIALAQLATRVRRIGLLTPFDGGPDPDDYEEPLRKLGWIEGKNIVTERRISNGVDGLPRAADELVRLKVDLILTNGTDAALAAKAATTTIPIVMLGTGDPVGMGIVASLSHPGGNITGYSMASPEIASKRASLLHELVPAARRVAIIVDPSRRISPSVGRTSEAAYRSLGVTPVILEGSWTRPGNMPDALTEAARQQVQAVEIPGTLSPEEARRAMETARRYRLAVATADWELLQAGALLYFDGHYEDQASRVAAIIDKVLRGARPADIPIEQPTRFYLGINLTAAKALGITVPQSLLLRADEVIQ